MRRSILRWVCVASLFCLPSSATSLWAEEDQQIPVEVLKQIKAATTLVKVRFEKSEGSGTGFLVATEGASGYLVTNIHVIAPLQLTPPKIIVTPQSTFDTPAPVWIRTLAPPRSSMKRGPTIPTRPGTKRPSPNIPRPGMPRSPTVRSKPGYRPTQPGYRGPSRSVVRVQLIPGQIQVLLPKSIDVVFDSGRSTERTASATVASLDLDHNLAILKVQGVVDMPKPITPPKELDLLETTPIYVFGFPFGKELSTTQGNPAMTVGSGIISGVRDDEDGDTQVVQIDGDINPGNSGGPVVDVKGQLIGLAVAGISGTNIGLAIPATELGNMLAGRAGDLKVTHSIPESGLAKIDIELKLIDPLHKIGKAAVRYRPTDELPPSTGDKKDGDEEEVVVPLPGAQELELKIEGQKATGSITVKADGKNEKKYTLQASFAKADKIAVLLPPEEPYAVKFQATSTPNNVATFTPNTGGPSLEDKFKAAIPGTTPPDSKATVPGKEKSDNTPPAKPVPPQVARTTPPPGLAPSPPSSAAKPSTNLVPSRSEQGSQAGEQLKLKQLSFQGRPARIPNCLTWSADGKSFYSLAHSPGKQLNIGMSILRRISFPEGTELARWEGVKDCNWFSLSSAGLLVTDVTNKAVWVLDPVTLVVLRMIAVRDLGRAVSAPSLGIAFASCRIDSDPGFCVIDINAGKIVRQIKSAELNHPGNYHGALMSQDGKLLFFTGAMGNILRWRVAGQELIFDDETDPLILNEFYGLSVSNDGQYVAAPCRDMGNWMIGRGPGKKDQTAVKGNYVFGPGEMRAPHCLLGQGEAPQAIAFDMKSGWIYGFNAGPNSLNSKFVMFNTQGERIKEFPLSTNRMNNIFAVRQILVHPEGRKFIILSGGSFPGPIDSGSSGTDLWYADLSSPGPAESSPVAVASGPGALAPTMKTPAGKSPVAAPPVAVASVTKTRTWTDASGMFSVEAAFIEVKDGKAFLRRPDGKKFAIAVEKLSNADQQYLASDAGNKSEAH